MLRLSQGQLNLLSTCPRKFQHTYLEQLASLSTPEQQERQMWGTRFHLLMQQWQLGLPVAPLIQEDPQLQRWFTAFVSAAPKILTLEGGEAVQQSEHARTLEFQGYLLSVVYDLLLTNDRQAQILDWKTYPRPQNPRHLLQNWQTRLYLFVLAETSAYLPAQLSMVYWFFQSRGTQAETSEPQSFRIAYDATQHEQTRHDLTQLLMQLTGWLEQYPQGTPFPQVGIETTGCERCGFVLRCDRRSQLSLPAPLPSLTEIEEVPL